MGDLNKGETFAAGETVTAARLHKLVEDATLKAGVVGTTEIEDGAVTTAKLAATAAFSTSQLTLANGKVIVGNGSGVGEAVTVDTGTMAVSPTVGVKELGIAAAQLAADAVETAKIKDGNVTLAKVANIASARILGRSTASSGVIEELTAGTGISISGGAVSCTLTAGSVKANLALKAIVVGPGGEHSWTHGLGSNPRNVQLWLECISDDSTTGNVVGDRIPIEQIFYNSTTSQWPAFFAYWNATYVGCVCYESSYKTAGIHGIMVSDFATTASKWKIGGVAEV